MFLSNSSRPFFMVAMLLVPCERLGVAAEPQAERLATLHRVVDLNVGDSLWVDCQRWKTSDREAHRAARDAGSDSRRGERGAGQSGSGRPRRGAGLGQLQPAKDGGQRADRLLDHQGLQQQRSPIPGGWTRTPGCGCGRPDRRWCSRGRSSIRLKQRWFAGRRRWPTSRSTSTAASGRRPRRSTTTTASTSAAPKGMVEWSPPPTAWSFPAARTVLPGTRTRRSARATTWSTCSTTAAGTIATAT